MRPLISARSRKALLACGFGAAALLAACGEEAPVGADPEDAAQVAAGGKVYAASCARCHGEALEGDPGWRLPLPDGTLRAPPLDGSGHAWHHADDALFSYTKHGPETTPAGIRSAHPPFAGELADAEIWAALAYVKSVWPPEVRARQGRH